MDQQNPSFMPQTMDGDGKTVGARVPPSFCAKCWLPPCAISGYETGDPTAGMCSGMALWAFILEILCCMGCVVSLCCWSPDPQNITGDGSQRTVEDKCMAGFCVGFMAIAFWENGDFCCGPDGSCTWCTEETMKGCFAHWVPGFVGLPPLDCCYVMCMWDPEQSRRSFRRDLSNHGGGQPAPVDAPVQTAAGNLPYFQVAPPPQVPQVMGQEYGSNKEADGTA
ncbi:unnamed protein product [Prorocentrum cordatum]|uniref:Uncharacterized protein n=1 Tax=Prorocentrum cordatum TaxID=2364126 RepID=A0ABN9RIW5_9DINO|nr:unnamed protein product [Polarella glacialis]